MNTYAEIAALVEARNFTSDTGRKAALEAKVSRLVSEHMPSGSGFNSGTTIDLEKSTSEKLVFHTAYHHMDDAGYYDGWTEHRVTVTPGFDGSVTVKVSGKDRDGIKDHIAEVFVWAGERS